MLHVAAPHSQPAVCNFLISADHLGIRW